MYRFIALLALVAAANAGFYKQKCPMVLGKFPFDFDKFHGDWYMSAANDAAVELKGKCVKISFPAYGKQDNREETALNGRFSGVSMKDNTPISHEAFLQPMISDKLASMYTAFRREGTSVYSPIYKTSIVSTDYTSYAAIIACKNYFDAETKKFNRGLFAEVWTREGVTLSKDTMDSLTTLLSSYDIPAADIKPVETKC